MRAAVLGLEGEDKAATASMNTLGIGSIFGGRTAAHKFKNLVTELTASGRPSPRD